MKFGVADYGMNVWDGDLYDLETRLLELKGIGFDGIERLEAASPSDAVYQAAKFHRIGMDFATVRNSRLNCSLEWTSAFGKSYIWLTPGSCSRDVPMEDFLRRARKLTAVANSMHVDTALHNHLGARIENQEELDLFMKDVPGAKLLLDIGHLFCAGGDPAGTIGKYGSRLAAVHFKDFTFKDRSKGLDEWFKRIRFCELDGGDGGTPWRECVRALKKTGFDGWCFVEHDTHTDEPVRELKLSLDLLKQEFAKE